MLYGVKIVEDEGGKLLFVSGRTYGLRFWMREHGGEFDRKEKRWVVDRTRVSADDIRAELESMERAKKQQRSAKSKAAWERRKKETAERKDPAKQGERRSNFERYVQDGHHFYLLPSPSPDRQCSGCKSFFFDRPSDSPITSCRHCGRLTDD